ncbi:MAG: sigma-54-dependent Fis family transcriptional regulator [Candidatus Schekmanbacteria bacterium]|nr:sigma-54-dependent Fis family transcriptional regulator [Candidatus Schekmanbacteria bacterium]
MSGAEILVVDDEERVLRSVVAILSDEGYRVSGVGSGEAALAHLEREPTDLVFLDISMPGIDGVEALRRIRALSDPPEVVMISAHGTVETAMRCAKLGAFNFLEKPLSLDKILLMARNAVDQKRLSRENRRMRREQEEEHRILGRSQAILELLDDIERLAPSEGWVLISGENGTGKELVARAIHGRSARAAGPFVDVNCAAIPDDLIESDLFGHERGSFTGADRSRRGKFELADGGSLFLDEVGDMSLRTQAKVLRVLEDRRVQRVGSSESIPVNVRVIAASNKDLEQLIRDGEFREDLYYRLRVIPLHVPALRDRADDVPLLVDYYLKLACVENKKPPKRVTAEAMAALSRHDWPGNVRELRNIISFLVIMSRGEEIAVADLPRELAVRRPAPPRAADTNTDDEADASPAGSEPEMLSLREARDAFEKQYILEALIRYDYNVKKTADKLQIERSNLHRKIKMHGIDVEALRGE